MIILFGIKNEGNHFHQIISIKELYKDFIERKNLFLIYCGKILLNLFFSWMVIYSPILLINLGMTWPQVGLIMTVALVPYIIFQYPAGWLADKICGEKEIMILGFLIMAVSAASMFFINSTALVVWMTVLFVTRIGASLVAIMTDTYFLKKVDSDQINLINFYHNSRPIGYFIGPLLASLLLVFIDLRSLFLILGMILVLGIFVTLPLKDTK